MAIECAVAREEEGEVLLVSFPEAGCVDTTLNLEHATNKVQGKEWQQRVTAESEVVSLVGKNADGRNDVDLNTCKWLVGMQDKATGNMTLHSVDHIFAMRSKVKGYKSKRTESEMTVKEGRESLFEMFGSRKKQKTMAANAANLVSADQAVGAESLSSWIRSPGSRSGSGDQVEDIDGTKAALLESMRMLLPPFDIAAQKPEDIFNVRGIIGDGEWGAIARQLSSLCQGGTSSEHWLSETLARKWPSFVVDRIRKTDTSPAEKRRLQELMLLRHLISLHLKQGGLRRSMLDESKALGMPEALLRSLVDQFTVGQATSRSDRFVYRITKTLQDKLLLYIIVMCLHLNNFTLNTSDIADDLRIPVQQCATLFRQVGCHVNAIAAKGKQEEEGQPRNHFQAELKVPLKFPERRRGKGK